MEDPGIIMQINESLFQSKIKYNCKRLYLGDCKPDKYGDNLDGDEIINN